MYEFYNPNPKKKNTGDCAVRALSKALCTDWENAKILLDVYSLEEAEIETADVVWGKILYTHGFRDYKLPFCEDVCDLESFCRKHPKGTYVVKLSGHVVCVVDGVYYDSWDSGGEIPLYYWAR